MVTAILDGCLFSITEIPSSFICTCYTDQLYTHHFTTQCIPCMFVSETSPKLNQSLNNLVLRLSDHPVFEHTLEVIKNERWEGSGWTVKKELSCSLLFQIQMSEQKWRRTIWQSFPHSQPTFLRIIIPSWQLTVSMHQIGSLICNQHGKLMVKMTILFLLYGNEATTVWVTKELYNLASCMDSELDLTL